MRQINDLSVYERVEEIKPHLKSYWFCQKGKKAQYLDVTSTFDIETTATESDGFAYSFAVNIGGNNIVFRYVEQFINFVDYITVRYGITIDSRMVMYIHNLGFEQFYLLQILEKHWGIHSYLFTKPHKPLYIRFLNGVEFRDSLKLFQKSLAGATKGCKHPKMKGDLDYSIYRTPETPLTDLEFGYIVNDVQGLYEAIERLKQERGYNQATIPLTNTAMVLEELNRKCRKNGEVMRASRELSLTKRQLELAYHCMAGGDTHGCRWRAGKTYCNCNSDDEKSAHPSQQLLRKFPMGGIVEMENADEEDIDSLASIGRGWIAEVRIIYPTIRDECPDPTISISKCKESVGVGELDNGRLLAAEAVVVYMDSNDWIRFKEAYHYEEATFPYVVSFKLDYLPETVTGGIFEKFQIKESYPDGPDKTFAKICVNTIFGAFAQKSVRDNYGIEDIESMDINTVHWEEILESMDDDAVFRKQKNRFPFLWGLWTSSLSRLTLWELLKAVGWENIIYWDTDSAKYEGEHAACVEEYNQKVRKLCEERGVVVKNRKGENVYIGIAEREHAGVEYGYRKFRFIHAKCYAAESWNPETGQYEMETTIAGVGKKEGVEALNGNIDNLAHGLFINPAGGNKLKYVSRPIYTRTDFKHPTECASYVYMEPREYLLNDDRAEILENIEMEIIAE